MTPDRIKAIAEEYAEYINSAYLWDEAKKEATRVIRFLNDRYCIVEREKVMGMYKDYKDMLVQEHLCDNGEIERDYWEEGAIDALEQLFGTSMFNQNEEVQ